MVRDTEAVSVVFEDPFDGNYEARVARQEGTRSNYLEVRNKLTGNIERKEVDGRDYLILGEDSEIDLVGREENFRVLGFNYLGVFVGSLKDIGCDVYPVVLTRDEFPM